VCTSDRGSEGAAASGKGGVTRAGGGEVGGGWGASSALDFS
jgi:hypothetical protein